MKILLLQTGGTIGSEDKNGVIDTSGASLQRLCDHDDVSFETETVYSILSENLSELYWEKLIRRINSAVSGDYDGIIITHGSDTLSYTSAMTGLCFGWSPIPIVITAANYVPDDPRSNAKINMNAAVTLIKHSECGVYTVYKNDDSDAAQVWLPTRMIEADRFRDAFSSRDGSELARISSDGSIIRMSDKVTGDSFDLKGKRLDTSGIRFSKSVKVLFPYPGADYKNIELPDNTGAVLHISYHSGTISSNARDLLAECQKRNIPLYICSVKRSASSLYETTHEFISRGIIPLYDITNESAFAKLLLAVNRTDKTTEDLMNESLYYE